MSSPPATESSSPGLRTFAVVAVVSSVVLCTEIASTRLLSYRFFYHFVFLIISLAQLGMAAAGTWLFALDVRRVTPRFLQRGLLAIPALTLLLLVVYRSIPSGFGLTATKLTGWEAVPHLTGLSVVMIALYLAGGLVLAGLFTHHQRAFNKLYAVDLAGAAAGCVGSVALMAALGPIRALLITALLTAVAVAVLFHGHPHRAQRLGAVTVLVVSCLAALIYPPALAPSTPTPLSHTWNHLARTDRIGPSHYVIDGDAATFVHRKTGMAPANVEFTLVGERPRVAVIGSGAGPQVVEATEHGASSVVAIDINPSIIEWSRGRDAKANGGVYLRPEVTTVVDEGRHAIRAAQDPFDLVLMHAVDTYTATSAGAYSLSENHLYTVEAMEDFLAKLRPGGVVAIRRWLFYPPRENLRLFTTAHAALARTTAADPSGHLLALAPVEDFRRPSLKVWGLVAFSNAPFSPAQLARTDAWVKEQGWSYLYRPGRPLPTPFSEFVAATDKSAFHDAYAYHVRPCYDANPFFFQLATPWHALFGGGGTRASIASRSMTTLSWSFGLLVVLCAVLLGLPLYLRRRRRVEKRPAVSQTLYFAALGAGFMAMEVATIQAMTLLLGHPVYALSVVLLGILLCAGAGSLLVRWIGPWPVRWVCVGISVAAVVSAVGLFPLVHAVIDQAFGVRVAVTLGFLGALCVPMGMPMASGIRLIRDDGRAMVAWAWVANGAAGVLAASLCMFVMIFWGIPSAFYLAATCYLAAAAAKGPMLRASREP